MDEIIFNRPITIYEKVYSQEGKKATLEEFLLKGEQYKDLIEQIRNTTDENEKRKLKNQLPCATISGVFEGTHKKENLKEASGLICLDIDQKDNLESSYDEIMNILKKMDIISFASRSVGGKGIFVIIKIAYPERFTEQFEALELIFKYVGITLDKQTGDITRLRYLSYDPQAWFRPNAIVWKGLLKQKHPHSQPLNANKKPTQTIDNAIKTIGKDYKDFYDTYTKVEACIEEIERRGLSIRLSYAEWVYTFGMPLSSLGEAGRSLYHRISRLDPSKYDMEKCDKKFTDLLKHTHSISIATFFDYCSRNNINWKNLLKKKQLVNNK